MKTQKQVQVLTIYRFKETPRICFVVESSNGKDTYNTCFNRDENHGSCTCPALRGCYHLDQLKARAAEYFQNFQNRQPAQPVQPEKANPVAEAFIAKVQAEKAAKAPSPRQQEDWSTSGSLYRETRNYENAPSGRLVPMR